MLYLHGGAPSWSYIYTYVRNGQTTNHEQQLNAGRFDVKQVRRQQVRTTKKRSKLSHAYQLSGSTDAIVNLEVASGLKKCRQIGMPLPGESRGSIPGMSGGTGSPEFDPHRWVPMKLLVRRKLGTCDSSEFKGCLGVNRKSLASPGVVQDPKKRSNRQAFGSAFSCWCSGNEGMNPGLWSP